MASPAAGGRPRTKGNPVPIEETLRFLDDAVSAGIVGYVGPSNFTGWQVQKAVDVADFRGYARPVTWQPQYNLLVRELE